MNKVLVKLYLPIIDEQYDVWLPLNKRIYIVIILLSKGVNELQDGKYQPEKMPILYNKSTGTPYDVNLLVRDTNIKNGTELILI